MLAYLEHHGRLTDTGVAAKQNKRAFYYAAAQYSVKLPYSRMVTVLVVGAYFA